MNWCELCGADEKYGIQFHQYWCYTLMTPEMKKTAKPIVVRRKQ